MQMHVPVEVRNHYDGQWAEGFEVEEETPEGYRLRRRSDASMLPGVFRRDEVREVGR